MRLLYWVLIGAAVVILCGVLYVLIAKQHKAAQPVESDAQHIQATGLAPSTQTG